jgi:hypothetical protein
MLAALRVLHIDTSHAQAVLAAIEERLRSMAYQLYMPKGGRLKYLQRG